MPSDSTHLERLRVKAKNEIGEKDDLIPAQIAQVRAIIAEDTSFVHPDERLNPVILRCLRARKYDVQRAAKMFKKYVIMRDDVSDMADKLLPSNNKELYQKKVCSVLISRDTLGRHIIFLRVDRWSTNSHNFDWILAAVFLMLDEAVESLDTQYNGIVVIIDFKGFGFSHVRSCKPNRIQNVASVLQDSYPARFKEMHFINHPSIFNMVYALIKPFLKEKMTKRIYFHGYDVSALHKVISPALLPTSLGGELKEDEYSDNDIVTSLLSKDVYYEELMAQLLQCKRKRSL